MKREKTNFYKVKKGDSLSSIAQFFDTTPTEFLINNSLSPKEIFPGNILFIK